MNYFEVKFKLDKKAKIILVEAVNYTDAETIAYREWAGVAEHTFEITNISKKKFNVVSLDEAYVHFFVGKMVFPYINDNGEEKSTTDIYLIQHDTFEEALSKMKELAKGQSKGFPIAFQEYMLEEVVPIEVK